MTAPEWRRAPGAAAEAHALAEALREAYDRLLADAGVERWYPDDDPIISTDPWVWVFPSESLATRHDVRGKLDRWLELASRLIRAVAPEAEGEFAGHEPTLRSPVSFASDSPGPSAGTTEKATWYVQTALTAQLEVLHRVIGGPQEAAELWLVPDTNALLRNPALEQWEGEDPATIVLIPQVLAELDEHKMHHRRDTVRRSAEKLIRQFDEFDRRGDTFAGVTIKDTLRFREIPVDADVAASLSWLRPNVADDQILASVLELRWQHPHVSVTLVTEDRNLRNKARQAVIVTDKAPLPHTDAQAEAPQPPAQAPAESNDGRLDRALIRVARVVIEDAMLPEPPLFQTKRAVSMLVVTLVNAGEAPAFDVRGVVNFHRYPGQCTREVIDSLDLPVMDAHDHAELRFPRYSPGWPLNVSPRSITLEGTYNDADGKPHPIMDS